MPNDTLTLSGNDNGACAFTTYLGVHIDGQLALGFLGWSPTRWGNVAFDRIHAGNLCTGATASKGSPVA